MNQYALQHSGCAAVRWLCTAILLGGMACSSALSSNADTATPPDNAGVSMPVSFDDLLALPIGGTATQSFTYGQAAQQTLLYFQSPVSPRATLLIVHGGCWSSAYDRQHAIPMATALALAGYHVWLTEYRRVGDPGGGWPGSVDDIVRATQQVAALSGEEPWLIGHSAGGHLALLVAADPTLPIKGAMALAAITDLTTYGQQTGSCPSMVAEFMGGPPESHPDRYALATVHDKVFPKPIRLIVGDADTIVGLDQLTGFTKAHTQIIAKSGHFDLIHPGTAAFSQVLETLRNLTQTGRQSDD